MSLSSGLVAAYDIQASGATWLDLTSGGHDVPLTNTDWVAEGLRSNANGEYGTLNNSSQVVSGSTCTVVVYYKSLSAFADSTIRNILTNNITNGRILGKYSDNTLWLYIQDGVTSHYIRVQSSDVPNWLTGTQIAFQWDINNTIHGGYKLAINIDGTYVTPVGAVRADNFAAHIVPDLAFLNDLSNTANEANGIIGYGFVFNNIKTASELSEMAADHSNVLEEYFNQGQNNNSNSVSVMVGL